jgi:hypothetical protein
VAGKQDDARDRFRRELEARGVDPLFVDAVLARVGVLANGAPPESYEAIMNGVEVAYRVHRNGQENLRRSLRDMNEVSLLMEDFGTELRKLDEALKTLAAYLGRMRARVGTERGRLLH